MHLILTGPETGTVSSALSSDVTKHGMGAHDNYPHDMYPPPRGLLHRLYTALRSYLGQVAANVCFGLQLVDFLLHLLSVVLVHQLTQPAGHTQGTKPVKCISSLPHHSLAALLTVPAAQIQQLAATSCVLGRHLKQQQTYVTHAGLPAQTRLYIL